MPSSTGAELVEYAVAVSLSHLGVNVEARVSATVEGKREKSGV